MAAEEDYIGEVEHSDEAPIACEEKRKQMLQHAQTKMTKSKIVKKMVKQHAVDGVKKSWLIRRVHRFLVHYFVLSMPIST